jgi:hypothetical protein
MLSRQADHQPIARPLRPWLAPDLEDDHEADANPSFLKELAFAAACAGVLWTIAAILLL